MKFHPGRLGIMTPKGETLPLGDIQKLIRKEAKEREEANEKCRLGGSAYYHSTADYVSSIGKPVWMHGGPLGGTRYL